MTDENQIEDQDVELHDEENEVVEGTTHDPKNAEAQSVASVDAAGDKGPNAKARKGDKGGKDAMQKAPATPVPGTKAGMINAAFQHMSKMTKAEMSELYGKMFAEGVEEGEVVEMPVADIDYQADFSDDLNALIADEATLSEEFKDKAGVIFEAAIKSKLAEEIDRLEEKYNEELAEEIESTKAGLVDQVDNYLNYVVEGWMEDNKVAIQSGLRTEIAEKFMNSLKDLFTESYIEVPESKVDLVDELAETVEELEEKLNSSTGKQIEMAEELETLKREKVIREASKDLAETQVEKLKGLVEDIDFEDEETFTKKVATVKESYFKKSVTESADLDPTDVDDGAEITATDSMAKYLTALRQTNRE
jgi:hypothetical protein